MLIEYKQKIRKILDGLNDARVEIDELKYLVQVNDTTSDPIKHRNSLYLVSVLEDFDVRMKMAQLEIAIAFDVTVPPKE